jgi:diguanylate cyclase (GGDEF)-like protein
MAQTTVMPEVLTDDEINSFDANNPPDVLTDEQMSRMSSDSLPDVLSDEEMNKLAEPKPTRFSFPPQEIKSYDLGGAAGISGAIGRAFPTTAGNVADYYGSKLRNLDPNLAAAAPVETMSKEAQNNYFSGKTDVEAGRQTPNADFYRRKEMSKNIEGFHHSVLKPVLQKAGDVLSSWGQEIKQAQTQTKDTKYVTNAAEWLQSPEAWKKENALQTANAIAIQTGEMIPILIGGSVPVAGLAVFMGESGGAWKDKAREMGLDDQEILDKHADQIAAVQGPILYATSQMVSAPIRRLLGKGVTSEPIKMAINKATTKMVAREIGMVSGEGAAFGAQSFANVNADDLVTYMALDEAAKKYQQSDPQKAQRYIDQRDEINLDPLAKEKLNGVGIGIIQGVFLGAAGKVIAKGTKIARGGNGPSKMPGVGKVPPPPRDPQSLEEAMTGVKQEVPQINELENGNIKTPGVRKEQRVTLEELADDIKKEWKARGIDIPEGYVNDAAMEAARQGSSNTITKIQGKAAYNSAIDKARNLPEDKTAFYLYGDIDHFKAQNDNFSHDHGDNVLRQTVPVVSELFKETGIDHFHISGDENAGIAIVNKGKEKEFLGKLAELKKNLEQIEIVLPDENVNYENGRTIPLSMTWALSSKPESADALLNKAKTDVGRNSLAIDNATEIKYNVSSIKGPNVEGLYKAAGLTKGFRNEPKIQDALNKGQQDRQDVSAPSGLDGGEGVIESEGRGASVPGGRPEPTGRGVEPPGSQAGEVAPDLQLREMSPETVSPAEPAAPVAAPEGKVIIPREQRAINYGKTRTDFANGVKKEVYRDLSESGHEGWKQDYELISGQKVRDNKGNLIKLSDEAKRILQEKSDYIWEHPEVQQDLFERGFSKEEIERYSEQDGIRDLIQSESGAKEKPTKEDAPTEIPQRIAKRYVEYGLEKLDREHPVVKAIDADVNKVLENPNITELYKYFKGRHSVKSLKVAVNAVRAGKTDGKAAVDIRKVIVESLKGGWPPYEIAADMMGGKPDFSRRSNEEQAYYEAMKRQLDLFQGTEMEDKRTPSQRALDAIVRQREEKRKKEDKGIEGLEMFEGYKKPEAEQTSLFTRKERKETSSEQPERKAAPVQKVSVGPHGQAAESLAKALHPDFGKGDIEVVKPEAYSKEQRRTVKVLQKLTSRPVVFIKASERAQKATGTGFDGTTYKNRIWITHDAERPYEWVGAHEVGHIISRDHPELYQVLVEFTKDNLTAEGKAGVRKRAALEKRDTGYGLREVISDHIADNFRDPTWWRRMYDKSPELVKTMLTKMYQWYSKVASATGKEKTEAKAPDEWFVDAKAQRDAVGKLLQEVVRLKGKKEVPDFSGMGEKALAMSKKESQPKDKSLVALHNIDARKLAHADQLGGIAMPSIAVTKKDVAFGSFGDISLIAGKETIDPKARLSKTFDSDIYSPRYPEMNRDINKTGFVEKYKPIVQKYLDEVKEKTRDKERILDHHSENYSYANFLLGQGDLEKSLAYDIPLMKKYLDEKGIPYKPDNIIDVARSNKHRADYDKYVSDFVDSITNKKRFFKGFTYSGNKRYADYNLENIVAEMKKSLRGGESFMYGAGNVRAQVAKKFSSVEQMKKESKRIVSDEEMENVKEEFNSRLSDVAGKIAETRKGGNSFSSIDNVVEGIVEGIKRRNIKGELESYGFSVTDHDMGVINKLVDDLRNAPTEYFESKVSGSMQLSDFKGAVIPKNTSTITRDILDKHGIKYVEYDPNVNGDRNAKVQQFSAEQDLSFTRRDDRSETDELGFFSPTLRAVQGVKQERGTGDQMFNMIAKTPGVKEAEWKWMGLDDFLKGKQSVTKGEIEDFIRQNQVKVEDVSRGSGGLKWNEVDGEWHAVDGTGNHWKIKREGDKYEIYRNGNVAEYYTQQFDLQGAKEETQKTINSSKSTGTKFSQYTLPGGENYREVLLTLPIKPSMNLSDYIVKYKERFPNSRADDSAIEDYWKKGNALPKGPGLSAKSETFKSSHWDEPNIIAHTRLDDRVAPNGEKVLFIQEIQSDWSIAAREKGVIEPETPEQKVIKKEYSEAKNAFYESEKEVLAAMYAVKNTDTHYRNTDAYKVAIKKQKELEQKKNSLASKIKDQSGKIPSQPFLKNWHELVLKRILRMAAEEGYDRVAWINGEQTANRYDLSKQVKKITVVFSDNGKYKVTADDNFVGEFDSKQLPEVIGKDLSGKVVGDVTKETVAKSYSGDDLKVSPVWAANLYDKMIPAFLEKYGRKWDTKVEDVRLSIPGEKNIDYKNATGGYTVSVKEIEGGYNVVRDDGKIESFHTNRYEAQHVADAINRKNEGILNQQSIPITPEMRESVISEGQPMFSRRDDLTLDHRQAGYESREQFDRHYDEEARFEHGETRDEFLRRVYCQGLRMAA